MYKSFKATFDYFPLNLKFKFDAGTSRGVLKSKTSYIIRAKSPAFDNQTGYGEAGPLPRLSLDDIPNFDEVVDGYLKRLSSIDLPREEDELLEFLNGFVSDDHPSIRFALETALLDLTNGGKKQLFSSQAIKNFPALQINGLIWMGEKDFMLSQIDQKIKEGFSCIKMKIGAIDFEKECAILKYIRDNFSSGEISIRVDANGAFSVDEALGKLNKLASYDIHSIEQPIRQGNREAMGKLCKESPIAVALDEELIGINGKGNQYQLLKEINPTYIILKPTLLGGIQNTKSWISVANDLGIAWWMTSALESNIGLNAIYQLTSLYATVLPQGLGTGKLYENNIGSPLSIDKGKIFYDQNLSWEDLESYYQ